MEELYEWLDSIQDYWQPAKVRHKLKDIIVIVLFCDLGEFRWLGRNRGFCDIL